MADSTTKRKRERKIVPLDARAYSVEDFMHVFRVGRTFVYQEIREGRLKGVKLGAKTLIPRDAADAWLASRPAIAPRRAA